MKYVKVLTNGEPSSDLADQSQASPVWSVHNPRINTWPAKWLHAAM